MPIFDRNTARIKMVVLNKNGIKNFRWYSHDKYTNASKADKDIIAGMLRRFMEQPNAKDAQVIQFYDNQTDTLIDEYQA